MGGGAGRSGRRSRLPIPLFSDIFVLRISFALALPGSGLTSRDAMICLYLKALQLLEPSTLSRSPICKSIFWDVKRNIVWHDVPLG